MDHFVAARSLGLADATTGLSSRPWLHSSAVLLVVAAVLALAGVRLGPWRQPVAPLLLVALGSHHLRDATRRGLSLWPLLAGTPPLPPLLASGALLSLPWLTAAAASRLDARAPVPSAAFVSS